MSSHQNEPENPVEWLRWLMDHLEGQVAFGDTKAGLLMTADSILLAALGSVTVGRDAVLPSLLSVTKAFLAVSFCALATGLLFALKTILPNRRNLRSPHASHANFAWIGVQDVVDFRDSVLTLAPQALNAEIADAAHGKAEFALGKFKRLFIAVTATQIGTIAAFVAATVEIIGRMTGN